MSPEEDVPTRREREVLSELVSGATYEDVAVVLGISINTVRTHVRSLYDKLGVRSKTAAVLAGLETGLVVRPRLR